MCALEIYAENINASNFVRASLCWSLNVMNVHELLCSSEKKNVKKHWLSIFFHNSKAANLTKITKRGCAANILRSLLDGLSHNNKVS